MYYRMQQVKLRILVDFERLPIEKFDDYWCRDSLFCKLNDDKLEILFF